MRRVPLPHGFFFLQWKPRYRAMNKVRAMLDALMGPNRDERERNKEKAREKFKDAGVCKSFLVGLCPMDPSCLGGKRDFKPCQKIHSEMMRDQFSAHPDAAKLQLQYEADAIPSFEYAVSECDSRIAEEKKRIREDWGNRRPPLPADVVQQVHIMRRESRVKVEEAEALEDDKLRDKIRLMKQAEELSKEALAFEDRELEKVKAAATIEEVCEICGTSYHGTAGDATHRQFKVHAAYEMIRHRLAEMKERVEKARAEKNQAAEVQPLTTSGEKEEQERARNRSRRGRKAGVRRDAYSPERDRSRDRGRRGRDPDTYSRQDRDDSRGRGNGGRDGQRRRRARDDSRSRGRGVRAAEHPPRQRASDICSRGKGADRRRAYRDGR